MVSSSLVVAGAVKDTVSAIVKFKNIVDGMSADTSLVGATSVARVEPLCLVDADVVNVEYLPETLNVLQNIFSGYYLQALQLLTNLGSVNVSKTLGRLSPSRSGGFESYGNIEAPNVGLESYKYKLPSYNINHAMEADAGSKDKTNQFSDLSKNAFGDSSIVTGKMYNVTIKDGGNEATVPVAIKLMVNSIPSSVLTNLMAMQNRVDYDIVERYHSWRAGRIQFVRDLILCKDLIDKHRNTLIKDPTGVYSEIVARQNKNLKSGILNGAPSLATASNLAIISSDTAEQIEHKLDGSLDNFKTRHAIFQTTNLMILVVIDKSWEQITFYHRGITAHTKVSVKDLKNASKKDGGDVNSILKAFIEGKAPTL
jgi:hypothetical protein